MAARLRLHLLGPLRLETPEPPPRGFGAKAKAMLCYLALSTEAVPKAQLETLFWPDAFDRSSLNRELTHIRKAVPQGLLAEGDTVQLDRTIGVWIDTETFAALNHQNDGDALLQALALYRGEFLTGFDLAGCPAFDDWLQMQRLNWHEQAVTLLQTLVQQRRTGPKLTAFARTLLLLEPWREEVHRSLLLLQGRRRAWDAAAKQFERCRRAVQQELGGVPSPETEQLYQHIQVAQKITPAALPTAMTPLVGRAADVMALLAWLARPGSALLTIIGLGGLGKTRLGLALAEAAQDQFLHGIHWLAPTPATTSTDLAYQLATSLRIPFRGRDDPQVQLINALRDYEMLLILDGFEQSVNAADLLAALLEQAPGIKIVATSRVQLMVRGEQLWPITPLVAPSDEQRLTIDQVEDYSALQLFLQIAHAVKPDFILFVTDLPALAQIGRLTEGTPLAIELAAAALNQHSCTMIAQSLATSLRFLSERWRGGPPRQQSLWATLEYSWQLLTEHEQQMFRRLAVFVETFPDVAAQQVTGVTPALLVGLVNKFFLRRVGKRYTIHELLREFGREKLREGWVEEQEIRQRHGHWFVDFLSQNNPADADTRESDALQALDQEIGNIRSAWEWAVGQDDSALLEQALSGMTHFYGRRSRYQEAYELIENTRKQLSRSSVDVDPPDVRRLHLMGRLLFTQGWLAAYLNHFEQARLLNEQALPLLRLAKDAKRELSALGNLARIAHNTGRLMEAEQLYRQCLSLRERVPHTEATISNAYMGLGLLYRIWGRLAEAEQALQDGLRLATATADEAMVAYIRGAFSLLYCDQGAYEAAWQQASQSLSIFSTLKDGFGRASSTWYQGLIQRHQGNNAEAKRLLQESHTTFQQIGAEFSAVYPRLELIEIAIAEGDFIIARQLTETCLPTVEEAHEPTQTALCYYLLGKIALHQQQWDVAEHWLQKSLTLHEACNYQSGMALVCCALGQIALQVGEAHGADPLLAQALTIAKAIAATPLLAEVLFTAVKHLLYTGEKEVALPIGNALLQCAAVRMETKAQVRALYIHQSISVPETTETSSGKSLCSQTLIKFANDLLNRFSTQ